MGVMGRYFLSVIILSHVVFAKHHKPPNFILILMDDLGYADVGYYGGDIPTPNIDELAKSGIRLNYHYAENVCSATRSALLTGRYAWKTQLNDVIGLPNNDSIDRSFELISDTLSNNGYDTLFVGKWHIGASDRSVLPTQRGFKHAPIYFTLGAIHYTQHTNCIGWGLAAATAVNSGELETQTITDLIQTFGSEMCLYDLWYDDHQSFISLDNNNEYVEQLFADKILEYLNDFSERKKDTSADIDPFFIYWAMTIPHTPLVLPPQTSTECDNLIGEQRQIECNMIYYADVLIGQMVDNLKQNMISDDTLIIFISDNGANVFTPLIGGGAGQALPFRGAKGNTFEGGVRTPAIISGDYLKQFKKVQYSGCNYNDLVYVSDFYAIMAHLAHIKAHKNPVLNEIDGINLWPQIHKQCKHPKSSKKHGGRNEIISYRLTEDETFYRAMVIENEYKLLVNPNVFGVDVLQSHFDFWENWVNYDGTSYIEPNETYYRLYNDFDTNNQNLKIFFSQCYEDYLDDDITNNINTEALLIDDNKVYLYKIRQDNIEACNIASDKPELVDQLMNKLYNSINLHAGSNSILNAEKGGFQASIDSYDCEKQTFLTSTWADNPEYQDVTTDWNTIFLSFIDKVQQCN